MLWLRDTPDSLEHQIIYNIESSIRGSGSSLDTLYLSIGASKTELVLGGGGGGRSDFDKDEQQAGAELCQARFQLSEIDCLQLLKQHICCLNC